jgi:uncharacterized membrane protein (DUF485 family)
MLGQITTIGIRRRAWTRGFAISLIVAIILVAICLILLGDFLVDWLWFSAIGYLNVFWTIIIAEAEVFFSVFVATAIILWANGWLASRFTRSPWIQRPLSGADDAVKMGTRGLLSECYYPTLRTRSRHHQSPNADWQIFSYFN